MKRWRKKNIDAHIIEVPGAPEFCRIEPGARLMGVAGETLYGLATSTPELIALLPDTPVLATCIIQVQNLGKKASVKRVAHLDA